VGVFVLIAITITITITLMISIGNDTILAFASRSQSHYRSLNVGSTDHAKLYIVDNNYLEEKLKTLLEIQGEIGLIVKMGLYSGLREDELVYVHKRPMCSNLAACDCDKLHVVDKPNGTSVVLIQWHRRTQKMLFFYHTHQSLDGI
jgi:intergrase/recombinase